MWYKDVCLHLIDQMVELLLLVSHAIKKGASIESGNTTVIYVLYWEKCFRDSLFDSELPPLGSPRDLKTSKKM